MNKGKKRSPETIQKLSKSKIGVKKPLFGKLPHNKGVKMSDEAKRKNMGILATMAIKAFDLAFRLNLNHGKMGWQIFAVATKP